MKLTRKPSSGNPNAGFDVAGAGNVLRWFSGAPVLDPTLGVISVIIKNYSPVRSFYDKIIKSLIRAERIFVQFTA